MTVPHKTTIHSIKSKEGLYFAILPLKNISDDPSIDIFCAGLVMDLITDLSRFKSLQNYFL